MIALDRLEELLQLVASPSCSADMKTEQDRLKRYLVRVAPTKL